MSCELCGRASEGEGKLCMYHTQALKGLRDSFEVWQRAMRIDWSEYLVALVNLEETGAWVKEVIEYLMSQDAGEAMQ